MSEPEAFRDIEANLSFLDDWEERYRYIIELGQALPPLQPGERNAQNKVNGCVSQAWLVSDEVPGTDGPILNYRGESDALIVRGLVAILIAIYSGRSVREIAETDAIEIFDRLGLREHLSSQRSNGLVSMVKRIRSEAEALV